MSGLRPRQERLRRHLHSLPRTAWQGSEQLDGGGEEVSVKRQSLTQMVFSRMIARRITMEMKKRGFEETSKQGNCRGKCAEPAHRKLFYKSVTGQANHLKVP